MEASALSILPSRKAKAAFSNRGHIRQNNGLHAWTPSNALVAVAHKLLLLLLLRLYPWIQRSKTDSDYFLALDIQVS